MEDVLKRFKLIQEHPRYFVENCVFTKNQANSKNPCQPFPYHLEYNRRVVDRWFENNKFIELKSRQMQQSWLMLACHLWFAMTGKDRDIYIKKQKWEEALGLLKRMEYIYENIPSSIWHPDLKPQISTKEGQIYFPQIGSIIKATAQGKDQLRGETPSALFIDEFAFQEDAKEFMGTVGPALQGESRLSIVSTPCALFGDDDPYHRKLFEDRTSKTQAFAAEAAATNAAIAGAAPIEHYREWRNPGNGLFCVEIHYKADPAKRDPKYKEQLKALLDMDEKQWQMEMELSWEQFAGTPVFGHEFRKEWHVLKERYEPDPELPILRGWDFGGNHAVVTAQIKKGRLYLLDEWPALGFNTRRIGQEIIDDCLELYPECRRYIDYVDPSGLWDNSKAAEGRACAQILKEVYNMEVVPGIQSVRKRLDSVMELLITLKDGVPLLQVNPNMSVTIQAFQSAYAYPEKSKANVKVDRPEKTHPHSDLMDCVQYMVTKMRSLKVDKRFDLGKFDDGARTF